MQKISQLIEALSRMKGISKKNATKIAYDLLEKSEDEINYIANTILKICKEVKPCKICNNLCENDICDICKDKYRDKSIICIVENSKDILNFLESDYTGLFHVLGGKIDPLNGILAEDLNIQSLIERINEDVKEIIFAFSLDMEGENTILYLKKIFSKFDLKLTKLASGVPIGSNIEFIDIATLNHSLNGRLELK